MYTHKSPSRSKTFGFQRFFQIFNRIHIYSSTNFTYLQQYFHVFFVGKLMTFLFTFLERIFKRNTLYKREPWTRKGERSETIYESRKKTLSCCTHSESSSHYIILTKKQDAFLKLAGWALEWMENVEILFCVTIADYMFLFLLWVPWNLFRIRRRKLHTHIAFSYTCPSISFYSRSFQVVFESLEKYLTRKWQTF